MKNKLEERRFEVLLNSSITVLDLVFLLDEENYN